MMDPRAPHAAVADGLESFTDADAALARIQAIYDGSADTIRAGFNALAKGETQAPQAALYPYLGITVTAADLHLDARFAYGAAVDPGAYGTTLTRPALLADYYREQITLLLQNHRVPVYVGTSRRAIPLPFVIENSTADVTETQVREMTQYFSLPDLAVIDDTIANGTYLPSDGLPRPLSLFTAERVDYSIARLSHYTATAPKHFQRFVLLTNYQRYVDEFCAYAQREVANGETYDSFV
ncbi:MAG: AMP nucleosidase, partial [Elstera sp.]